MGSPHFNQFGVIALASIGDCWDIDCKTPYNGEHRTEVAYLVGWRTEYERLFRGSDSKAAIAWANHTGGERLRNDRVLLTDLPVRAVQKLYAA